MRTQKESYKVLIINPFPIDADCPIGIMMSNLFEEFESNRILQYYTHECKIELQSKFKSRRIDIRPTFAREFHRTVRSLLRKEASRGLSDSDSELRNTGARHSSWQVWLDLIVPSELKRDMFDEIHNFRPDVIYTQVYSYSLLKLVIKISNIFLCPIVVHTLDDWMGSNNKEDIVSWIPDFYFNKMFKKVLNNGEKHMVASPKMKCYMERKYGGKYSFVMNCSKFIEIGTTPRETSPLKLVYTGGLMLERFQVLDEVATILKSVNRIKAKYEMHVFAPDAHIRCYQERMQDNIIFHNGVKHCEVSSVLRSADVLMHVESFNPNVVKFTKYSLSTKIPEYLSSAKPVIYYGPKSVGVAEFLAGEKIGICTDSSHELEECLVQLYDDRERRIALGEEGCTTGKRLFDKGTMQATLSNILQGRGESVL